MRLLPVVLLAACSTSSAPIDLATADGLARVDAHGELDLTTTDALAADLGLTADAGSRDMTDTATYAGSLTVGSNVTVDFTATSTSANVSAIHIANSVGTIDFQGTTYPAVVYEHIPFESYDLASIVGTTGNGLFVVYAYCESGAVTDIYAESLTLATTDVGATPKGTCSFTDTNTAVNVAFTKPSGLDYGTPADIATVDGTYVHISGGKGTLNVNGTMYALDVFTTVDCSSCSNGGWQELHATITDGTTLAFGIFYLEATSTTSVLLAYGFRFDTPMLWPVTLTLDATWSLK